MLGVNAHQIRVAVFLPYSTYHVDELRHGQQKEPRGSNGEFHNILNLRPTPVKARQKECERKYCDEEKNEPGAGAKNIECADNPNRHWSRQKTLRCTEGNQA
jgi:hypothetical protein